MTVKIKTDVFHVVNKTYEDRKYSVVEGYAEEVGLYRVSVSSEVGEQAMCCLGERDSYIECEILTNKDFKPVIKVTGFEI